MDIPDDMLEDWVNANRAEREELRQSWKALRFQVYQNMHVEDTIRAQRRDLAEARLVSANIDQVRNAAAQLPLGDSLRLPALITGDAIDRLLGHVSALEQANKDKEDRINKLEEDVRKLKQVGVPEPSVAGERLTQFETRLEARLSRLEQKQGLAVPPQTPSAVKGHGQIGQPGPSTAQQPQKRDDNSAAPITSPPKFKVSNIKSTGSGAYKFARQPFSGVTLVVPEERRTPIAYAGASSMIEKTRHPASPSRLPFSTAKTMTHLLKQTPSLVPGSARKHQADGPLSPLQNKVRKVQKSRKDATPRGSIAARSLQAVSPTQKPGPSAAEKQLTQVFQPAILQSQPLPGPFNSTANPTSRSRTAGRLTPTTVANPVVKIKRHAAGFTLLTFYIVRQSYLTGMEMPPEWIGEAKLAEEAPDLLAQYKADANLK